MGTSMQRIAARQPPAIEKALAAAQTHLDRIDELTSQPMTEEARAEMARRLQAAGSTAFGVVRHEVAKRFKKIQLKSGGFEADVAAFTKYFGHPPSIDEETGRVDVDCTANAVVQSMLLSRLRADRTGSVNTPMHVVPAVKLGGATYVLDHRLYGRRDAALTLREYARELAAARADREHPLNLVVKAKDIVPDKRATPAQFAGQMRYMGGSTASLAAPHFNIAYSYAALAEGLGKRKQAGFIDRAMWHYGEAIRHNPYDPDAYHNLGEIHHERGEHELAEAMYRKSLALRPGDPDTLKMLGKLLKQTGRKADAKALRGTSPLRS